MEKTSDYYRKARREVLELVPGEAERILDIGCGAGVTWEGRPERRRVSGIELDAEVAAEAATRLDRVFVGNIETMELPFDPGEFDCIVLGDILEHLVDPWRLLARLRGLLVPGGTIVSSIPNVQHYRVVRRLLGGRWEYRHQGILDRTHLRFFTRKSLRGLFEEAGYSVVEIRRKVRASGKWRFLNVLAGGLLADFITFQYLVRAVNRHPVASG